MRYPNGIMILIFTVLIAVAGGCAGKSSETESGTKRDAGTTTETPAPGTTAPAAMATPVGASTALDGQTFEVQVRDASGTEKPDQLIFAGGTFESTACAPYGFEKSGYVVEEMGGAKMFKATTKSPTDGTMEWHGTIREREVEGMAKWTNLEGKVAMHTFKGSVAGT